MILSYVPCSERLHYQIITRLKWILETGKLPFWFSFGFGFCNPTCYGIIYIDQLACIHRDLLGLKAFATMLSDSDFFYLFLRERILLGVEQSFTYATQMLFHIPSLLLSHFLYLVYCTSHAPMLTVPALGRFKQDD